MFDDGAKREPSGRLILTAEDRERFAVFSVKCAEVLELFAERLPADELTSFTELSFVGEPSLMVQQLTAALAVRNIPVTTSEAETLREVTSADSAEYLAALTIVPEASGAST